MTLDDVHFFVDSISPDISDNHVGQMLCGFAFDCGALLEARLHVLQRVLQPECAACLDRITTPDPGGLY